MDFTDLQADIEEYKELTSKLREKLIQKHDVYIKQLEDNIESIHRMLQIAQTCDKVPAQITRSNVPRKIEPAEQCSSEPFFIETCKTAQKSGRKKANRKAAKSVVPKKEFDGSYCYICEREFPTMTESRLKQHIEACWREKHGNSFRQYYCSIGDCTFWTMRSYNSRKYVKQHITRIHRIYGRDAEQYIKYRKIKSQ